MENNNENKIETKKLTVFESIFMLFTFFHLAIDLFIWGFLYLPEKTNFIGHFMKGQEVIGVLLPFASIIISIISYIMSVVGLILIIKYIIKRQGYNVLIILFTINLILLLIAIYDPNSLYNIKN